MSNFVPDGWTIQDLGDVTEKIEGGGTPSRAEPAYWSGDIPWVTVKDLKRVRLSLAEESISELGLKESASRLIPKNTMIIATRMALGKAVMFDRAVTINQDLKAVFPRRDLDSEYLLHWYLSKAESIQSMGTGSTVKGIRLDDLRLIPIALPPLKEQQKIASIFTAVDEVIASTTAQINKLKDLKTGMMQELLTKGIGHTEFKDSPLGRIPKGWSTKKFDDVLVKVGSGITPTGGSAVYSEVGIPFIRSQNVYPDGFRFDDIAFITEEQHNKMKSSQLLANDVLLNITGASIGRCYYLPNEFAAGNVNQHVCILRCNFDLIDQVFLTNYINSDMGQRQIMNLQAGGNREGLNFQQIKAMILPLPRITEQREISKLLSAVALNISMLTKKMNSLMDCKKALMQDLLTGKVRVN